MKTTAHTPKVRSFYGFSFYALYGVISYSIFFNMNDAIVIVIVLGNVVFGEDVMLNPQTLGIVK